MLRRVLLVLALLACPLVASAQDVAGPPDCMSEAELAFHPLSSLPIGSDGKIHVKYFFSSGMSTAAQNAFNAAAARWNAAGLAVKFERVTKRSQANITVKRDDIGNTENESCAMYDTSAGTISYGGGVADLVGGSNNESAIGVFVHELGHVLGLDDYNGVSSTTVMGLAEGEDCISHIGPTAPTQADKNTAGGSGGCIEKGLNTRPGLIATVESLLPGESCYARYYVTYRWTCGSGSCQLQTVEWRFVGIVCY